MKRTLVVLAALVTLLVAGVVAVGAGGLMAVRARVDARQARSEAHLAAHGERIVDEARTLLAKAAPNTVLSPDAAPPGLNLPDLWCLVVAGDHVKLIVSRNPDTERGYRVWPDGQPEDYDDTPTDVPGVYRYRYCDDFPVAPDNRP